MTIAYYNNINCKNEIIISKSSYNIKINTNLSWNFLFLLKKRFTVISH